MTLIAIPSAARRAWPWIPYRAPAGAVLVGPDGEQLRVTGAGLVEPVVLGGTPWGRSVAADPCAWTS